MSAPSNQEMTTESPTPLSSVLYELRIKFEPYYIEYHADQESARLPRMFNLCHLQDVSPKVLLCDPAGNIFQVSVEINNNEAMFTRGWNAVGKFYGLQLGGWVRLVFAGSDIFIMQLKDRLDRVVHYPLPARFTSLGDPPLIVGDFQKQAITNHGDQICRRADLFHVLVKDLTAQDVTTGFLHIPQEFCKVAFRKSGIPILVFDEYGYQATCLVEFDSQNPALCGITVGWEKVTNHRKFFEGLRVELAVPCENPHLMSIATVNYHFSA